MAEYIDRKKYMKDKYNCDLIQIDNVELVPLYQIIDKLEQSIERSKIDKAIEVFEKEIEENHLNVIDYADGEWIVKDFVYGAIDRFKRNIGENKEIE